MVGCITEGSDYKVVMRRNLEEFSNLDGWMVSQNVDNDVNDESHIQAWADDIWFDTRPKDDLYALVEGIAAESIVQRCFAGMSFCKNKKTAELLAGDYTV